MNSFARENIVQTLSSSQSGGNLCCQGAYDAVYHTYRLFVVPRRQNKPRLRRRTVPLNTTVGARNVSPTRALAGPSYIRGVCSAHQGKIYNKYLFSSALGISFFTPCHMTLSIYRLLSPTI